MKISELYAFKLIKGIGDKSLLNLIKLNQSVENIRSMDSEVLGEYIKGSGKVSAIREITNNYDYYQENANKKLKEYEQLGIQVLSYTDSQYPILYKNISKPPIFLFTKGNIELLNHHNSIAIVGTRECSHHGDKIASSTAKYFAERDFNIVSGLALGIDTAAHKGAISVNGKTTAVVVDIKEIFPSENKQLSENILDCDGVLISENEPGAFINRGLFVSRDRLQSGLSLAVFPIETDIKGGTMHTVGFAKEQNRLLYSPDISQIPYDNNFNKIKGIKKIIDEGTAQPYTSEDYEKIIADIGLKRNELFNEINKDELTLGF